MNTNKPVVLYRSELPSSKGRQFVASALLAISLGAISLQAGFVLNASAEGNPISSPVTSEENPVSAPEVNPTPAPTSQPSNSNNGGGNNNNSGSSNNSGGGAPSCNNEAPKAPKIVSAVTSGKNEITLIWEKPVSGNVSHYSVAYGLMKGKPLYGVANVGNVNSFKVSGLSGGVTYYFIVKAVNDCTPSAASNEVVMKVGGKFLNTPAAGFSSNGVLGKNQVKLNAINSKPAVAKPVVFNTVTENKPANNGLAGKVVNFFKGFFN